MVKGTVKWFNKRKGYGFIIRDDQKDALKQIFVHYSNIIDEVDGKRNLSDGASVTFEVEKTSKGDQAVKVRLI